MGRAFRAIKRGLAASFPAGLLGAFLTLQVVRLLMGEVGDNSRMVSVIVGYLYGIGVRWLLGCLKVAPWAYPWLGAVVGPVPIALLVEGGSSNDERAGIWVITMVGGFLIGLLEWGRTSRRPAPAADESLD